jgi:hypothetical protein
LIKLLGMKKLVRLIKLNIDRLSEVIGVGRRSYDVYKLNMAVFIDKGWKYGRIMH